MRRDFAAWVSDRLRLKVNGVLPAGRSCYRTLGRAAGPGHSNRFLGSFLSAYGSLHAPAPPPRTEGRRFRAAVGATAVARGQDPATPAR